MTIQVSKPYLPPIEEYNKYLQGIWSRNWLTNDGPLVCQLSGLLQGYLKSPPLTYLSNGTLALQLSIKALELKGEIITTPFSYVATTSSIVWENCRPVFVDINNDSFNIDAALIEAKITNETTAILATHVFGNPCDVDKIETIAQKHNLKVIYDGAHCFGVKYNNKSIFEYGDLSTISFHATKVFHTIEGGAIFSKDETVLKKLMRLRNFGFSGVNTFTGVGINAKNSEFHAAMGLCIMKHIDTILQKRKEQYLYYKEKLAPSKYFRFQEISKNTEYNYSYFPVIFENEERLIGTLNKLELNRISPRRYFYPSLSTLDYVNAKPGSFPVAENISKCVLCLPLYHELSKEEQDFICNTILSV